MSILHYFPTFQPNTTDLKQHARNIQLIATWFKQSPLAQNLKLSHAQEWVAKAYGYNSYAGFKAQPIELNSEAVVCDLIKLMPQSNPADQLFLNTAQSYLKTDRDQLDSLPCFIEPTPLLLAMIERIALARDNLFLSFAVVNYLGMQITRNGNQLTYRDTLYLNHAPHLKEVLKFLVPDEMFLLPDDETPNTTFGLFKENNEWNILDLLHIDRPIKIDAPEISLSDLAKTLGVKQVLSFSYQSLLMDNIDVFTRHQNYFESLIDDGIDNNDIGMDLDESWGLQLEETGLRIEFHERLDEGKAKDDLDLGVVAIVDQCSFKLEYLDQSGQRQQCCVTNAETYLDLYRGKNSFRFYPAEYEEDALVVHGLIADTLNHIGNAIIHSLEKYQYVLSCVWLNSDADFEHEMRIKQKLKNQLILIEAEVEKQGEAIQHDVMMNLHKYFDKPLLDEFVASVKQYDEITQPEARRKAIDKVINDKRFEKRLHEVLESRTTALRDSLYKAANLNLTTAQVNIEHIRSNHI